VSLLVIVVATFTFIACGNTSVNKDANIEKVNANPFVPSQQFRDYWFAGQAEITSFSLSQARYGNLTNGTAVLIYVTEDLLPGKQVKADNQDAKNIPVLKLNSTKDFNTGIYPYHIMQSSFYPIADNAHAIKLTASVQEWCGQAFTQLNNRKLFEVMTHSYFENEADSDVDIAAAILENELWNKIRIRPELLPVGEQKIIPSLEFCRLMHKELKAYKATASLTKVKDVYNYSIAYPELTRELSIQFSSVFPYDILSWTETYPQGAGASARKLTTVATKMKQIKIDYWTKNKNQHLILRDSLGLK
jgi:hypothetical protein